MREILLYFHVPFCTSKCNYCAFNSFTNMNSFKKEFVKSALYQLKHDLKLYDIQKNSISSLFIGGGTPSSLKADDFEEFFSTLKPYLKQNAEISCEANPNSANFLWLKKMKNLGVNRISFGVQSFFDEKLKFLGREHSSEDALKAIENAKNIGFNNISIDYMYATIKDSLKSVKDELNIALKLPINHISAYSLTIEENTPFFKKPHYQKDDEKIAHFIASFLNENGFKRYEVSNYGKICKHNQNYWKRKPYLGIGAGAVGFINEVRYYPHEDIKKYIKNPLFKHEEILTKKDIFLEKLFLGFRSSVGVEKELFSKFHEDKLKILLHEDKIYLKNDKYFCKEYFLADEIVLFLLT